MYDASAVLHKEKIYVIAGDAPQRETLDHIFSYNITINKWSKLPSHGYIQGRLQIINDQLTVIGGWHRATNKPTNNVSTFNNNTNSWTVKYPSMIKARCKPGVITHGDHVIVLGGGLDGSDDIEVLNWTQPRQWMMSNIKLPEPMFALSLTISDAQIYIVGYYLRNGDVSSKAYQLPIDSITSSVGRPSTSGHSVNWDKLPDAPHFNTTLLPGSNPPVIIGGHDTQFISTSSLAFLNTAKKTWDRKAYLTTARSYSAVVPISHDSILVIGGTKGREGVAANQASSITTVEKGTVTLSHSMATPHTPDTPCTIQ